MDGNPKPETLTKSEVAIQQNSAGRRRRIQRQLRRTYHKRRKIEGLKDGSEDSFGTKRKPCFVVLKRPSESELKPTERRRRIQRQLRRTDHKRRKIEGLKQGSEDSFGTKRKPCFVVLKRPPESELKLTERRRKCIIYGSEFYSTVFKEYLYALEENKKENQMKAEISKQNLKEELFIECKEYEFFFNKKLAQWILKEISFNVKDLDEVQWSKIEKAAKEAEDRFIKEKKIEKLPKAMRERSIFLFRTKKFDPSPSASVKNRQINDGASTSIQEICDKVERVQIHSDEEDRNSPKFPLKASVLEENETIPPEATAREMFSNLKSNNVVMGTATDDTTQGFKQKPGATPLPDDIGNVAESKEIEIFVEKEKRRGDSKVEESPSSLPHLQSSTSEKRQMESGFKTEERPSTAADLGSSTFVRRQIPECLRIFRSNCLCFLNDFSKDNRSAYRSEIDLLLSVDPIEEEIKLMNLAKERKAKMTKQKVTDPAAIWKKIADDVMKFDGFYFEF